MVIIAREFAVTILRTIAAERGLVIAASWLGKVKTVLQIAAVIALIAVEPGAGLGRRPRLRRGRGDGDQRRRLLLRPAPADRGAAAERTGAKARTRRPRWPRRSSHSRIERWRAGLAARQLGAELARVP